MKKTITEQDLQKLIAESVIKTLNENEFNMEELDENVENEGIVGALVGGTLGAIFGRAAVDAIYNILSKSAVQAALGAAIGHAVQEEIKQNPALLNPFKKRNGETVRTPIIGRRRNGQEENGQGEGLLDTVKDNLLGN